MSDIDYLTTDQVTSPELLARYIQQRTGTPWATGKDLNILRKKCKDFFKHYPQCDYYTLCRVADWCQRRKRRYSNVWKVVDAFRYAYEAGALPEVDRLAVTDPKIEAGIDEALAVETDKTWRSMLITTSDITTRRELLKDWQTYRKPVLL